MDVVYREYSYNRSGHRNKAMTQQSVRLVSQIGISSSYGKTYLGISCNRGNTRKVLLILFASSVRVLFALLI